MPFFWPASLLDLLSDIEAGGAELAETLLQEQRLDIATEVTLQEPNLDVILMMLKLVAIDLTELLQTGLADLLGLEQLEL